VDTYLAVIDSLIAELSHRLVAYEEIHSLFSFFAELRDIDVRTVEDGCSKLAAFYHADLAEQDLISECKHFKHHIYCWHQNEVPHPTVSELYSLIKADSLEATFPNIEIALRIYLTMMPTNCIGECSFSKLKIVKNHLRSCMLHPRLTSLSVMNIESDLLEDIDFHA